MGTRGRRLLLAVRTDAAADHVDGIWLTRCIHCKAQVGVRDDGEPVGTLTSVASAGDQVVGLAYIKRAVAAPATAVVSGASAEICALPMIG